MYARKIDICLKTYSWDIFFYAVFFFLNFVILKKINLAPHKHFSLSLFSWFYFSMWFWSFQNVSDPLQKTAHKYHSVIVNSSPFVFSRAESKLRISIVYLNPSPTHKRCYGATHLQYIIFTSYHWKKLYYLYVVFV